MRGADPPVSYLVGTPKGRRNRLEQHEARPGVQVKLLPQDGNSYPCGQHHRPDRPSAIAADQAATAMRAACQFHGGRSAILFAG
jgi:hypothetical protein